MARKEAVETKIAAPKVGEVSPLEKKPRKKAVTASVTAPEAKAKMPRQKVAPKVAVVENENTSIANLAAALNPVEIEQVAYLSWVERGCPVGSPEEDWFRAEQALLARYATAK